jgi:Cupin
LFQARRRLAQDAALTDSPVSAGDLTPGSRSATRPGPAPTCARVCGSRRCRRPRVLLWKHMAGRGDWAWGFPAGSGVVFGRVVSGHCRFRLPGAEEQGLEPGDCLLLTEPPAWILRGGAGDAATIALEDLPTDATSPELVRGEDDPSQVRVVGGHFEFDSVNKELLTAFLPPVAHIRSRGSGDDGRLAGVLAMIDAEASDVRPGQEAVLSRLLEIVLIELLRTPETLSSQQRGMLTGLSDAQIASALRAFHADIRRNWSVASLSAAASMSRPARSARPSPERSAGRRPDSPATRAGSAVRDIQRLSRADPARSARHGGTRRRGAPPGRHPALFGCKDAASQAASARYWRATGSGWSSPSRSDRSWKPSLFWYQAR